ncbi:MAG: hypothetical protein ACXAAP_16150 [Candidatus Thorarchaeota archaeon]|jgi:flavodoxin
MTYLVVYYSRTGNNRTIAEAIADTLSADIDEIIGLGTQSRPFALI